MSPPLSQNRLGYDGAGRMITKRHLTHVYDGLGNWKNSNSTLVNSDSTTSPVAEVRQHNYVNEITTIRDTVGSDTPTTTPYTYDACGNLLFDGLNLYSYDVFNRLNQVVNTVTTDLTAYAFDVLNRRGQKAIYPGGGLMGIINSPYDGQQIVGEIDNDSGDWLKVYFWGQYIDELLFFTIIPTPITYRVMSDLLYRSTAVVDTSNNIIEAYDTDAYGNTLCYSGPGTDGLWFTDDDVITTTPLNTTIFTGRHLDIESGLYYYRARSYSPTLGRFLSRDPLKNAELRQGPNLYAYVRNNAVNVVDPAGLSGCCASQDAACVAAFYDLQNLDDLIQHLNDDISGTTLHINDLNNQLLNPVGTAVATHVGTELITESPIIKIIVTGIDAKNLVDEEIALRKEISEAKNNLAADQKLLANLKQQYPSTFASYKKDFKALVDCTSNKNEDAQKYLCFKLAITSLSGNQPPTNIM